MVYKKGAIDDPSPKRSTKIKIVKQTNIGGSQYLVLFLNILNFINIFIFIR